MNNNQNIIYNYPKTSAQQCNFDGKLNQCGIPSNMSVTNCNFDNTNFTRREFRNNIEPALKSGYYNLNPQSRNYATDIYPIYPRTPGCDKTQYAGLDPRLYNNANNDLITLNLPPITSEIYLDQLLTDKSLNNYGQNYTSYSDINAGQIMYYIDRSEEDPITLPVFALSADVTGNVYKDPMDSFKPEYIRKPLTCDNPIGAPTRTDYQGGLSFMEDTLNFREDIISKQMAKQNQMSWNLRWPVQK
jgi:hypothetical protein